MRTRGLICLFLGFAGLLSGRLAGSPQHAPAATPAAPDFAQDILPIIEDNCLRCHSAAVQKGGLVMDTHEDLMIGGENGTVLTPGNASISRLVQMIQAEIDPKMPPKSTLRPDQIATFKAWIDAGAKDSAETPLARLEARIPAIVPDIARRPAVNAVAFNADGTELAVPGYREVRRVFTATTPAPASAPASLGGAIDLIRSVAYSSDGAWVAGAGGIPGAFGEVLIWNASTGALAHTLKGHRDYVYHVAFNQRGTRIATCSYDKTTRVWDVETGRPTQVFRQHTEAVYAVAFSPDDKWVASGAGDRSVKIWDLASGARLYTLTDPTDVVQTLAFRPRDRHTSAPTATDQGRITLSAAGADKTIRVWELTAEGGTLMRSLRGHGAPILRIVYSPDGKWLASSDADGVVKIWDATSGQEARALEQQPDWAQGLAWSPDGSRLAVGRYDGTVGIYDAVTGRRVSQLVMGAAARVHQVRRAAQP
jgi:Planctomycete cytochrome C/WD domain, G-beta repeat/Anaphase-promoting complex subunit 4 WD40 domain